MMTLTIQRVSSHPSGLEYQCSSKPHRREGCHTGDGFSYYEKPYVYKINFWRSVFQEKRLDFFTPPTPANTAYTAANLDRQREPRKLGAL